MLRNALTHWKSSLLGIVGAAIVSTAAIANVDKLTAGQLALAFGLALVSAVKGLISADASAMTAPKA